MTDWASVAMHGLCAMCVVIASVLRCVSMRSADYDSRSVVYVRVSNSQLPPPVGLVPLYSRHSATPVGSTDAVYLRVYGQ